MLKYTVSMRLHTHGNRPGLEVGGFFSPLFPASVGCFRVVNHSPYISDTSSICNKRKYLFTNAE